MIQSQVKLKLNKQQEEALERYLFHLYKIWNWAIRKIELDGEDHIFHKKYDLCPLLNGVSKKLDLPSRSIQGMLEMAWTAWDRCYKKISKKPKLKGMRNKLSSIPFPDPIKYPTNNRIKLPKLGSLKFHKQYIPEGKIKCGRVVKRSSGWYLCFFIDAMPKGIQSKRNRVVGIDPGFKSNLTTTDKDLDDLIAKDKKKRFEEVKARLAQAQKGKDKKLTARLLERVKNRRKDDNHKLSRKLVEECREIYFSKDSIQKIAKKPKPKKKKTGKYKRSIRFGKSVQEAGHYQLRQMLSYKCTTSGRKYKEVDSKYSTMTCSNCLARNGPTGKACLSVRMWECTGCGSLHDRDRNAAINTLSSGLGMSLERVA